jgi:hypothetical protein
LSFIPKTLGGLAYGLIDGKPGAFSNIGSLVGGSIDPFGIGKKSQQLVNKTGVNGRFDENGVGYRSGLQNDGNALPVKRLSGRGSNSLSV